MKQNLKYYPKARTHTFHFDHVHIKWNQQVPLHQQETWELSYIITGSGVRIIGDIVENFSKGEVILIPPNIPHCWSFDESVHDSKGNIENITIVFENVFLENCKNIFPELMNSISELQSNENAVSFKNELLERLQTLMTSMIDQNSIERLSSFIQLLELISYCKEMQIVGRPVSENKKEKKLQEIYLFILNNFQRNITLEEISRSVGMQKSSFCVFFKKMTGKSFFTYLTEFRIESSCQMLLKTKLSVAEICIASGFSDIPYYNRVFKKIKNIPPTQFRKNAEHTRTSEIQ
ncbi:AraC family transcriptional regulator [Chryseobacterium culicis]|uniref:AraC family transcriptional regulator n=1 Tax=Chryseobacterium culicis TaxID=680127 RepID=A0A2S9CWA7_CHRCI|nr:AraC family transcriptional regulator [Chryseobacterium culicis]PRB84818.1 AraC family transcriptional regulator [Chryseobacterium culicis]PRB87783.1 AraC family transcriptional regulator [Chryseobacterium culicis]